MNKKLLFTLGLALTAVVTVHAQDDDDLYFTPSKKQSNNMSASIESVTPISRPTLEVYSNNNRTADEYNRRYSNYAGSWQTGGGEEVDSLTAMIDSLEAEIEILRQGGYDVYDPELDYTYSRRILRFHSPRLGLVISSPYYWDLVYDYGVYDYLYDPFYNALYDPFYWDFGWRYGWSWGPWDSWYGPMYGWYAPQPYDYWGIGPMWHPGIAGSGVPASGSYHKSWNRGTFNQNRYSQATTVRTSALAATGSRSGNTLQASTATRTSAAQSLATRTRAANTNTATGRTSSTRTSAIRTQATNNTATTNRQAATRTQATTNTATTNRQAATRTQATTNTATRTATTTTANTATRTTTTTTANTATRTSAAASSSATRTTSTPSYSSSSGSSISSSSSSSFGGSGGSATRSSSSGRR